MKWPSFFNSTPNEHYNFTYKPGDTLPVRILISIGLLFMAAFVWVYFQPGNQGYSWLYVLLTISVVFKLLRLLHEWYHYWNVVPPTPPVQPGQRTWTVDVLTTYCPGEPHDMVINTLQAIQRITYPHTTYLCDEANDPYLRLFCETNGIRHVTRIDKTDAKAGNINHALQQATGDICLIIDPDHVPVPDFLDHVLPYFDDTTIGFVQCVQGYYNRKESIVSFGATEQTYSFYGPMMTCMGQHGTAQAIGANCTFRRAALDTIGGHANGLSEDMHTAMKLHAKGWKSIYVPLPLSYGLVPATLSAYYKQQLKWARGTFELLATTYPRVFTGLSLRQKIHYATLPLYYLLGLIYLFDLIIPIGSLLLMELPLRLDLLLFATAYTPLLLTGFLVRQYTQRWLIEKHEAGFHLVGGMLASGTWWVYVLGLIYTILRVKVPYIPTPKDDKPRNNIALIIPNLIMLLATIFAISYCTFHYWRFALGNTFVILMIGFAFINALVLMSNVLVGQEVFVTKAIRWLDQLSVNRPAVWTLRIRAWQARYGLYGWLRQSALPLFAGMLLLAGWLMAYTVKRKSAELPHQIKYANTQPFYYGFNVPGKMAGLRLLNVQPIVPQHLTWSLLPSEPMATPTLNAGSPELPLLYLVPDFGPHATEKSVQTFLGQVSEGLYDRTLLHLSGALRSYKQPVLMSLMPAFDAAATKAGVHSELTHFRYQEAWRYIVRFYRDHQVNNLVWIWCPANPSTIVSQFPGGDYVDWIGISVVDDPLTAKDGKHHSFTTLFQEPHNTLRMHKEYSLRQKPVVLVRFGTVGQDENALQQWTNEAITTIKERYPHIRGILFDNPKAFAAF
ncbi:glycosyltransferase [Fibrella sp. HMF5405]|uniref:Glycosyltransferase n=2 Tax=Fibrella forsythiae TaxID=2817061 RepID=A0ABS3JNF1_9BACT|nr:glycosyltransferase [Fibrella forsythiae]